MPGDIQILGYWLRLRPGDEKYEQKFIWSRYFCRSHRSNAEFSLFGHNTELAIQFIDSTDEASFDPGAHHLKYYSKQITSIY
jgi:hypothetical protein